MKAYPRESGVPTPLFRAFFFLALLSAPAGAEVTGRLFGDFGLGGGYDSNLFSDAGEHGSSFWGGYAGLGWRGRLDRFSTGWVYYRFTGQAYPEERTESSQQHEATFWLRRRLAGPLALVLAGEAESFGQDRLRRFDYRRAQGRPGLEVRALDATRLRGYFLFEAQRYPRYDLDFDAPGYAVEADQEIGRRGRLRLLYQRRRERYLERRLWLDATGAGTDEFRRDRLEDWSGTFTWTRPRLAGRAGFSWIRRRSNANFLDYGPGQSAEDNATIGDERLLADYYSSDDRGPFAGLTWTPPGWMLAAWTRWSHIDFRNRIARDAEDRLQADDPKRAEERCQATLELTRFLPAGALRLGVSLGGGWERSWSNDPLYDYTDTRATVRLRGWF